jgi:hypothetical protein
MPCTLQPWEIEIENKLARQREGKPACLHEADDLITSIAEERDTIKKIADERTRLLCSLCKALEADRLLRSSLTTARALGAQREAAVALSYLGGCASLYGGTECSFCQEALRIFRELDDRWGIATAFRGLGWVALHQGNYPLARDYFAAAFGAAGEAAKEYMARLSQLFDPPYLRGDRRVEHSRDVDTSSHVWILDPASGAIRPAEKPDKAHVRLALEPDQAVLLVEE